MEMDDIDSLLEGHPVLPPPSRDREVKVENLVEELSDDEEEKEVADHEDCHVIENSLNNFFYDDDIHSDTDSSQLVENHSGGDGSRGPIHPGCLPAANEGFTCFQRIPPRTSLISIEEDIKQFIANHINSKKDPKCSHEFYALIHRKLYVAMRLNLFSSPDELDEYWLKFDNWATYAYQDTVIRSHDHRQIYLEQIQTANDPSLKPPNPTEIQEKQTPQHFYRINCTDSYKSKITERMETTVCKLILSAPRNLSDNPNALPFSVRYDIRSRVKFYLKWRSYHYSTYKNFLDYYWNIFLNRRSEYYESHPPPKHFLEKEPPQVKKIRNFQTVRNVVLRRKKFQRERLIKNCVNECIDLGIDPRASHKFHWTIHRCLQAVYGEFPENRISLNEMLRIWKKFDEIAVKAWLDQEKFDIVPPKGNGEYYEEADELPPLPSSRPLVELPKLMGSKLYKVLKGIVNKFVMKYGYGEDGEFSPILASVEIRREFLMKYVGRMDGNVKHMEGHRQINFYWRELVTRTCNMFKGWRRMKEEEKEKAARLIDKSQRGRVRKGVSRFTEEMWKTSPSPNAKTRGGGPRANKIKGDAMASFSGSSTESAASREDDEVPWRKKFDMDRIVRNAVNLCIELGVDPRTCHRFYWTVYRCLEFKFEKEMVVEEDVRLKLWRAYDALACKAFLDKKKFTILPVKGNGEYYEDVDELEIRGGNLQWKGITLLELKADMCSSVMGLVMKYGAGGGGREKGSRILEDVGVRRKFFLSYASKLEGNGTMIENEIDRFWKVLVSGNGETLGILKGGVGKKGGSGGKGDSMELAVDDDDDSGHMNDDDETTAEPSTAMQSSTTTMNASSTATMTNCADLSSTMVQTEDPTVTMSQSDTAPAPSPVIPIVSPKMSTSFPPAVIGPAPPIPQPVKMDTQPAAPPAMPLMGLLQGELVLDVSSAKQRESFLQLMSCVSNKFVVKVQLKNELLTD